MPTNDQLPDTLKRSPAKARRTWQKTHDSAVSTYGEGERAHRAAYAALKHSFEKVGDHWQPKSHRGPSDPRAMQSTKAAREGKGETFGGVDYYGHTKTELMQRAKQLDIKQRSSMNKADLARAISRKQ
jgi:cation transport regulator ChaB